MTQAILADHQQVTVDKVDHRADKEDESDLSIPCVIIEPNISVITVSDDDSFHSSDNANPLEEHI